MMHASPRRGWLASRNLRRQQGQALIYGFFFLVGGLAALFFLFNTGQLTSEKTKLVNTTDAVAYSGGVMNARALNFDAYANRAMIANTVAIAQLVSLSSWVQYTSTYGQYADVMSSIYATKYPLLIPSYYTASFMGPTLQAELNESGALENLAKASDKIIRNGLMTAQSTVYLSLLPMRKQVMDQVAQANYLNDGVVVVDPIPLTVNEFTSFVSSYSGNDRTRFADVVKKAVDRDGFVRKRSWDMPAIPLRNNCPTAAAMGRFDWYDRRGGTEMVSFDEWKAMDTLSEKIWVPKNKTDAFCQGLSETPAGWGGTSAADNPTVDLNPTHYDMALPTNPSSAGLAMVTSASWGYSGLPNFYDLSTDALKQEDPRMVMAIRVRREIGQTKTSEGRSEIVKTPRLNDYAAKPIGGNEMAAVSAAEVFFERDGDNKKNRYGDGIGKPTEIGSLFNPYWQVRLVQSDSSVKKAQLLQGVVLP